MAGFDKAAIVVVLEEIGTLLDLKGENPFKVRAYRNAARALEGEPGEIGELLAEDGRLEAIRGIGEAISLKIRVLAETGRLPYHEELKAAFPPGLTELLRIQGLGPKRVKVLFEKLKIKSLAELEAACMKGTLAKVPGFGAKLQESILHGLRRLGKAADYHLISFARAEAEKVLVRLRAVKGVTRLETAGSLRRHREIVRDIDVLCCAAKPAEVHNAFVAAPEVIKVLAHGDTKSSVILKSGMSCDLRTVSEAEFPFALQYFTGSKEHNVLLRGEASKAGYKLNEYGLFKGRRSIVCRDEAGIYKALGYRYIPPELREGQEELSRARDGELPELLKLEDIRGVFHVHSTYSDGTATLEDMVAEAERLGYEYIGISDHSQVASYARGLEPERVDKQKREVEALRKRRKITIFWGTECDILPDGRLDYPDSILKGYDFVIGSIHSDFKLSEEEQTRRLLRAMESRYMTFAGHLTGRLLLGRAGFALDVARVFDQAKKTGVVLELNANPHRLELDWRHLARVKSMGLRVSIHPDAHSKEGLRDVAYGVGIARKGWLTKADVVNTGTAAEVAAFLKSRR